MIEVLGEANAMALVGFAGGIGLGLAARLGRFCTLGAIEDYLYSNDHSRIYMWSIACSFSVILTHLLLQFSFVDPYSVNYLTVKWNPLASIFGGLLFGYGMALAGNCGYGALAKLGGGDLRSLVIVILMGLSSYFVLSGPLAHFRIWVFPVEDSPFVLQSFSFFLESYTGIKYTYIGIAIGVISFFALLLKGQIRQSPNLIFWGLFVAVIISLAWVGTSWVADRGFDAERVQSFSFAQPLGDTLFYGMTASGNTLSFGVGAVFGVITGAFIGSFRKGHFRWEACDDPRELKRQMLGAVLMGPGAIIAIGCSIGQGLSAFSLLAFGAPITLISIFIGAKIGLAQLISGFEFPSRS